MNKRQLFLPEEVRTTCFHKSCLNNAMAVGPALQAALFRPFHSNISKISLSSNLSINLYHEVTHEYFRHCCPGLPDTSEAVQQRLAEFSGVEIHAVNNDEGSIVITLEDTPDNVPSDVMMDVQKTQGVLAASLIYNYCDEECV